MSLLSILTCVIVGVNVVLVLIIATQRFLMEQALKKFLKEIQFEMKEELTRVYWQLVKGKIEIQDFYLKQERLGQLYSKIFEDNKLKILNKYSKPSKGRTKVK